MKVQNKNDLPNVSIVYIALSRPGCFSQLLTVKGITSGDSGDTPPVRVVAQDTYRCACMRWRAFTTLWRVSLRKMPDVQPHRRSRTVPVGEHATMGSYPWGTTENAPNSQGLVPHAAYSLDTALWVI